MSVDVKKDILWRVYLMYALMLLFAISIIGRILFIQFAEGEKWKEKSKEQSIKYFKIEAIRGNIYSDDFSLLATSVPIYDVFWDGRAVREYKKLSAQRFYQLLDTLSIQFTKVYPQISAEDFKAKMKNAYTKGKRYQPLARKVDFSTLKKIKSMALFNLGQYKGGLIIIKNDRRLRPHQDLAKRTIGIYHPDMKKYVIGLEGGFDKVLKGKDGIRVKQKIAGGWKPISYMLDETVKEPQNGNDIVTTINVNIQDVAQDALFRNLLMHDAEWGCVILMEVKTGYIKAIANLHREKDTLGRLYSEAFNHAIGTAVEPGSTFKIASLMVALEDEKVTLNQMIHTGNGKITYYGRTMSDAHDGGYGDITVKQVLEKSSNVGVFKVVLAAYQDNPSKFIDGLYRMGLNKKLGLQMKGEGQPYIKDTKNKYWSRLSLPWMSVGYELTLTPLQLLTFYNAIANGGTMVKPQFVSEVQNTGRTVKKFAPIVINKQIASKATIKMAQEMLEGVVQHGTASFLKSSPYLIAGKTGTAQISNGGYNKTNYRASFVGYFPADNPRYSCIVVVNNPSKGQYYAAQVAVPVFREIADKIYATELDIHPTKKDTSIYTPPSSKVGYEDDIRDIYKIFGYPTDSLSERNPWVSGTQSNNLLAFSARTMGEKTVPNVLNMSAKDAIYLLEKKGIYVSIIGRGKVVSQSIQAGSTIVKGQKIYLTLSN